ncbi:methyltransferase domain-containing protein [Sorangium sp. So ce327]|jgi:SAM-dependent methyltransferase|uniref:class I SAM-dependent methyltransferase n=1 Tax=Sorangium sp. So ce327 TaxID=3133301 RepID=UPI003F5E6BD7
MSAVPLVKSGSFDGLAKGYDQHRPRYPAALLRGIRPWAAPAPQLDVVDIGAGTGIALEGLIAELGPAHRYHAVDVSADMIATGREKLPQVTWLLGRAEDVLRTMPRMDVVLAAQAMQWMDREAVLAAVRERLSPGGVMAILQNNRDYARSAFLDAYESLLEELSPGYSRRYRAIDYAAELRAVFDGSYDVVVAAETRWVMHMPAEAFVGMSRSSTQVQRAIAAHGDGFTERLAALLARHAPGGAVDVPYESQLFLGVASAGAGG